MKKYLLLICIITLGFLSGCGFNNHKFEYIKDGNVTKVVIQSVRDKNFKFIITDRTVLEDLYELLSKGKETKDSTSLSPDYIFEIHQKNKEVKKYYYIVGLDRDNNGNFYNNDEKYIISKRIDNDLLKNFFNIRTPINFKAVYYESIIKALESYDGLDKCENVNVNIVGDKVASKFIFSTEEREFNERLENKYDNTSLNKVPNQSALDVMVKTIGYKSKIIKIEIEFSERNTTLKKAYVLGKYIDNNWIIDISSEKQEEF